jgi:hypothetical protein
MIKNKSGLNARGVDYFEHDFEWILSILVIDKRGSFP